MNYVLQETTSHNGHFEEHFDNLADALRAYGNLIAERIEGWGEENCKINALGKFHTFITTSHQSTHIEIIKRENVTIDVQVTGSIEMTERELRKIIEQGDDNLMAEIIKRSFSAGGFATLTPGSVEVVNGILNTEYEYDDFEWEI